MRERDFNKWSYDEDANGYVSRMEYCHKCGYSCSVEIDEDNNVRCVYCGNLIE